MYPGGSGNDGWNSTFAPTLFTCVAATAAAAKPCTLNATFANGKRLTSSLSSPTSLTWMPGSYVWTRATPSVSCLGSWADGGGNAVVVSPTAISGPQNGWYPAVVNAPTPAPAVRSCAHLVSSATDCFAAAQAAVGNATAVLTSSGDSDAVAAGCTVAYAGAGSKAVAKAFFNTKSDSKACCGAGVTTVRGTATSLVGIEMAVRKDNVTITLTGPATVWFGLGFFAQAMEEKPYSIIVDGVGGTVTERVLASHMGSAPSPGGSLLEPSVTVVYSTVADGKRTVVLTRPAAGATAQHASFTLQDTTVPFINAIGSSPAFGYHLNKTASSLSLWPTVGSGSGEVAAPACMCEKPAALFGHATGNIKYLPTGEEFGAATLTFFFGTCPTRIHPYAASYAP